MSYIELRAKEYASKNLYRFDEIIKEYEININMTQSKEYCYNLYTNYKNICKFDNIIKISYLFENNKLYYNNLINNIKNISDINKLKILFLDELGNIYKTVFDKEYKRLSVIENIKNTNEFIQNINNCIKYRIQYHYHCKNHQIKYNVKAHEHEMLFSIYMYNKLLEVAELLNIFYDKYKILKENLQEDKENIYINTNNLNYKDFNSALSEKAFELITSNKRTKRKSKKK